MSVDELAAALRRLHAERNADLERRFNRNLSFADGLFDRWERAAHLGFGEGASIYDSALVFGDVQVGPNTWVGPYTLLDGSGGGIVVGCWLLDLDGGSDLHPRHGSSRAVRRRIAPAQGFRWNRRPVLYR